MNKEKEDKIVKIEYSCITQVSEFTYDLKVNIFDDGLNIDISGVWYNFSLKTKYNQEFITYLKNALNNLHFENWDDDYQISTCYPLIVTDLPNWELKITYSSHNVKKCKGYGAYPKNWDDFEKIIDKLVPLSTINNFRK